MTDDAARELRRLAKLNQSEFWSRIGVTQSGGSHGAPEMTAPSVNPRESRINGQKTPRSAT